ncbi:hypothetical protein FHR84_002811 [Actinopolyspora biskrensis]|uniref:PE family protein n=1 Tax=Actinopolyspora biskrensis TaxID=1470178 RepID=A0A852ZBQ7_9ACTN|nr:hypothetical protein [Actinopolyspora biskrensis]NYH79473.1 hypothetical protein [Actinopolyspora biskrensis]
MPEKQGLTGNLSATNDAMQGIITAANKGEFTITPDAGDELIQIFEELDDWLESAKYELTTLKQRTPLGNSPAGESISNFNKTVAAGDEESYEALLQKLSKNTPEVISSIKQGIALYQKTDDNNSSQMGNLS